jgi:hypothetical protein
MRERFLAVVLMLRAYPWAEAWVCAYSWRDCQEGCVLAGGGSISNWPGGRLLGINGGGGGGHLDALFTSAGVCIDAWNSSCCMAVELEGK